MAPNKPKTTRGTRIKQTRVNVPPPSAATQQDTTQRLQQQREGGRGGGGGWRRQRRQRLPHPQRQRQRWSSSSNNNTNNSNNNITNKRRRRGKRRKLKKKTTATNNYNNGNNCSNNSNPMMRPTHAITRTNAQRTTYPYRSNPPTGNILHAHDAPPSKDTRPKRRSPHTYAHVPWHCFTRCQQDWESNTNPKTTDADPRRTEDVVKAMASPMRKPNHTYKDLAPKWMGCTTDVGAVSEMETNFVQDHARAERQTASGRSAGT